MVQDRWQTNSKSIGAICNDLERPLTQMRKSRDSPIRYANVMENMSSGGKFLQRRHDEGGNWKLQVRSPISSTDEFLVYIVLNAKNTRAYIYVNLLFA